MGPKPTCSMTPSVVGFVRHGTADQPGCVVVMTNDGGQKTADLDHHRAQVQPDDEGIGQLPVKDAI